MCPRRPTPENTAPERPAHGAGAPFLREVRRRAGGDDARFPFTVPVIRTVEHLRFDAPETFFVGDNQSGKSTLLKAIATAARLPAVGSADLDADTTLGAQREMGQASRLVWFTSARRGFFLRAEDFFGFARRLSALRGEMLLRIAELEEEYADRSAYAKGLAMGPARASLAKMESRDGIIATHSPILLAFPGATIYSVDQAAAAAVPYAELDHVVLTREFLNAPERYLRALRQA